MRDQLNELLWQDVSILQLEDQQIVLILLCKNQDIADRLYEFIKTHKYKVSVGITNKKTYKIALEFLDTDYGIGYDTERTADQYPPFKWLASGQVKSLTTGIRLEDRSLWWNTDYLRMDVPSLN